MATWEEQASAPLTVRLRDTLQAVEEELHQEERRRERTEGAEEYGRGSWKRLREGDGEPPGEGGNARALDFLRSSSACLRSLGGEARLHGRSHFTVQYSRTERTIKDVGRTSSDNRLELTALLPSPCLSPYQAFRHHTQAAKSPTKYHTAIALPPRPLPFARHALISSTSRPSSEPPQPPNRLRRDPV